MHYTERSKLIEDASLVTSFTSTLSSGEQVERIRMSSPSVTLFSTLGAKPILGRLPVPEDESRVVVLSYALWQNWFGGDPKVLGKTLQVSGDSREVIGVMASDFRFPVEGTLLWFPGVVRLEEIRPGRFGAGMIARMKPGVTTEALAQELTGLSKQLPERFGGPPSYARIIEQHRAVVRTMEEQLLGAVSGPLWILLSAVTIVLLIACANVANLFMVRAEGRQRDLAVRRATGSLTPTSAPSVSRTRSRRRSLRHSPADSFRRYADRSLISSACAKEAADRHEDAPGAVTDSSSPRPRWRWCC